MIDREQTGARSPARRRTINTVCDQRLHTKHLTESDFERSAATSRAARSRHGSKLYPVAECECATPIDFAEDLLAAPRDSNPDMLIQSPLPTLKTNKIQRLTRQIPANSAKSAPPAHPSCNPKEWKTMINLDAAADRDRVVGLPRRGIPRYGTLPDDEDRPKLLLASPRREVKVN